MTTSVIHGEFSFELDEDGNASSIQHRPNLGGGPYSLNTEVLGKLANNEPVSVDDLKAVAFDFLGAAKAIQGWKDTERQKCRYLRDNAKTRGEPMPVWPHSWE